MLIEVLCDADTTLECTETREVLHLRRADQPSNGLALLCYYNPFASFRPTQQVGEAGFGVGKWQSASGTSDLKMGFIEA